ncbi:MAG TPA: tripartite tricarboxylate transporter substrate-binding protein, partial [Burkholderiales bacterium]|nr:tripartite tricarboxylate transporter substrate-binding protein [Burkholderiales bacterium]
APQLPDVPTMTESGYAVEMASWQSLLAPAGTPRPIIDSVYRESVKALNAPDVIDRLATQGGNELVGSTPEEFAAVIKRELGLYSKAIKDANIKLEQ